MIFGSLKSISSNRLWSDLISIGISRRKTFKDKRKRVQLYTIRSSTTANHRCGDRNTITPKRLPETRRSAERSGSHIELTAVFTWDSMAVRTFMTWPRDRLLAYSITRVTNSSNRPVIGRFLDAWARNEIKSFTNISVERAVPRVAYVHPTAQHRAAFPPACTAKSDFRLRKRSPVINAHHRRHSFPANSTGPRVRLPGISRVESTTAWPRSISMKNGVDRGTGVAGNSYLFTPR